MRHLLLVALLVQGCGSSNSDFDGGLLDLNSGPPDLVDAMPPPIILCKVLTGEGCAAGQHCTAGRFEGIDADLCIPDPGLPIAEGDKCTPIEFQGGGITGDFCTPGLVCASAASVFRCAKPCYFHTDCKANQACSGATSSPSMTPDREFPQSMRTLNACVTDQHCDPITQTNCFVPGTRCVFSIADDLARVTVCGFPGSTGGRAPGAPCASSSECLPGVRCSGLGFCRKLCYQDAPANATVGKCTAQEGVCSPIFGGGPHYGECD